jgi:hypothetical protein
VTTLKHRYLNWQTSVDGKTRAILLAVILLTVQPLLVGELSVLLSSHKDSTVVGIVFGFVILAAILTVLLGALIRRRRWAWLILIVLFGSVVVLDMFNFNGVRFVLDVIGFALLISPSMRRYVNQANESDYGQRIRRE